MSNAKAFLFNILTLDNDCHKDFLRPKKKNEIMK